MVSYWIGVSRVSMMDQATHQQKRIYASFLSQIDWTKRILVHKSHEKNWINFQNWIWRRNGSASFNLVFWILVVEILILMMVSKTILRESGIHGSLGSQGINPRLGSHRMDPRRESGLGWMGWFPIRILGFRVVQRYFMKPVYGTGITPFPSKNDLWWRTDRQTGHDAVPIYK